MALPDLTTPGGPAEPTAERLTTLIAQEIANALGFRRAGPHMRVLHPLVRRATGRFAALVAAFDADVGALGFRTAAERFASHFIEGVEVTGAERVPATGPLIIAANHPGVSDAVVIASSLPREDTRLVISDVPLVRALPHGASAFIPVSGNPDEHVRALRDMLDHLRGGGSVIVFPSSHLTPDPAHAVHAEHAGHTLASATFDDWSPSIVLALRRVPSCRLQPAIVRAVTAPRFARHPLTRLIRAPRGWERQRLAEMLQVLVQVRRGDRLGLRPRLTFGAPISAADLGGIHDREAALTEVKARAAALLEREWGTQQGIERAGA